MTKAWLSRDREGSAAAEPMDAALVVAENRARAAEARIAVLESQLKELHKELRKAEREKATAQPEAAPQLPLRARPVSEEEIRLICERLVQGRQLRMICKDMDISVEPSDVRIWLANNPEHAMAKAYARSRELQGHALADDLLDLSDHGKVAGQTAEATIARCGLQIATRQWRLEREFPHIWGKVTKVDHTSKDGSLGGLSPTQVAERISLIIEAAQRRKESAERAEATLKEIASDDLDFLR